MTSDIPVALTTSADALSFAGALQVAAATVLVRAGGSKSLTGRAYARHLADFLRWYAAQDGSTPFSRALVYQWRESLVERGISASSINQGLTPIRALASELALAGAIPEPIAAGIERVKGVQQRGKRLGNWLTEQQINALVNLPNCQTRKGLRDRAILVTLIGSGLRRYELAALDVSQIQMRDGRWTLVDIAGKHHKIRSVPINATVYVALRAWLDAAHITAGSIFRAINRGDRMTSDAAMTPQAVRDVVKRYVCQLNLDAVAPHDLRRTFAKTAHRNGVPLEQIQLSLGHESIDYTALYVGTEQDFQHAPSDAIVMHLDE